MNYIGFGNYVISGSCKTLRTDRVVWRQFGNYVISGSCKTLPSVSIVSKQFGNYVISGSCKTPIEPHGLECVVWELCDFWKL